MSAVVVLLLAVLSRILPVALHSQSWNFSLLGGSLLFLGAGMAAGSARQTAAKIAGVLAVLMATDYWLTAYGYGFPFHASAYLVTWVWYIAICLLGMGLLAKVTFLRAAAGAIAAPTSFFLLSNFAVWAGSTMYAHTAAGLGACYVAGLPFYRNDLVSTAITVGALFGLPVFASRLATTFGSAPNDLSL